MAIANYENLKKIFTLGEGPQSTLYAIEKEISENIQGFLSQHIVAEVARPIDIEKAFEDTKIPESPCFVSEQTHFLLENVVSRAVHTCSPKFIGHMTSAVPHFMLPLAKIMMALNQNLVKIETSKSFTPLERQVIGMLHRLIYQFNDEFYEAYTQNRDHALGVFCGGGTVANLTALWAARNKLLKADESFPGISEAGYMAAMRHHEFDDLCIVVSELGHYSLKKAADILGLGKKNLIRVPVASDNKVNTKAFRDTIIQLKRQRKGILAIVGVAGTTETGHVDPIKELAEISDEFQCHFHVDAAWGGPTLFSKKHGHILAGIEKADSVIIDAHKQLYVPVGAGICLFKNQNDLGFVEQNADYIIRKGSRDLGKHSIEGSRNGMALLVHSGLKIIGKSGYELLIDNGIELAKKFSEMIHHHEEFEVISEPELNILTYRYVPPEYRNLLETDPKKVNPHLNDLTVSIQKQQRRQGQSFVSRTTLNPYRYSGEKVIVFRVVLANPLTTVKILSDILDEQSSIAKIILKNSENSGAKSLLDHPSY